MSYNKIDFLFLELKAGMTRIKPFIEFINKNNFSATDESYQNYLQYLDKEFPFLIRELLDNLAEEFPENAIYLKNHNLHETVNYFGNIKCSIDNSIKPNLSKPIKLGGYETEDGLNYYLA